MIQAQKTTEAGISAVRVDGWDSKCEVFVTEKTRKRLHAREVEFELLNAKSTECYLVKAPNGTPLVFVGIVPLTFMGGSAYIWLLPFEGLKAGYLREMKKLFEVFFEKFTLLVAQVFYCETNEKRFVKYFGFTPTQEANGMTIYEKRKK